jgi:NADH-quinone oxidoreductase subunit H
MTQIVFNYFIFPGLLFAAVAGMLASWIDRKVAARIQWRVGPPFLQPFYDMRKLFFKEIILPEGGSAWLFVLAPLMSVLALGLISDILVTSLLRPSSGFVGDLIVLLYLFMIPPIAGMLGASASHNPMASLGASREMKLMLSYELPFILSLVVPIIHTRGILLGGLITFQQSAGSIAGHLSGLLALGVGLICLHSKMGLAPFDIGDAETEISSGGLIEYSGPLLALWKLGKMMMLVVGPLFLVTAFWAGGSPALLAVKYLVLLVLAILIRNTNPRLRIDQAMRFYWGPVTLTAIGAVLLALAGY